MSFELSKKPLSHTERAFATRGKRIAGFVPLVWCVIAVVVQLIVVAVMVPVLPRIVAIELVGKGSYGWKQFSAATSDVVIFMWVVIAICVVASIVLALIAALRQPTPWLQGGAALVVCILSVLCGLLLANLIPQLGTVGPATVETSGGAHVPWAIAGFVIGLALGLLSILWLPKKIAGLRSESTN